MDSGTPKRSCSVPNCKRKFYAKGFCRTHYYSHREGRPCGVPDCGRSVRANDLCKKHYVYAQAHDGDPLAPRRKAPAGTGSIDNGYRRISVNGKLVREHRYVMEQAIGRKLYKFENVHHKNGIRHDNRLDNLELWVKTQPCGQRPEDLAAFLAHYYPDVLKNALGLAV